MLKNEEEILETIHAIEEKKKELEDAQFIVEFNPKIISELELHLFKLVKEEDKNGVANRFKGTKKDRNSKRVFY